MLPLARPHSHWSGVFNLLKFDRIAKKKKKKKKKKLNFQASPHTCASSLGSSSWKDSSHPCIRIGVEYVLESSDNN